MTHISDETAQVPADGEAGPAAPPSEHPARRSGNLLNHVTVSWLLQRVQVVILAPFVILLAISAGSFVYGGYLTVQLVFNTNWASSGVSGNIVKALQVIDVCLIGTAALVIAAESLVMFMARTDRSAAGTLIRWIGSDSVDVLKNRALSMVVLILVVTFLEGVVHPRNGTNQLELGLAVATVIIAISLYLLASRSTQRHQPDDGA